MTALSKLFDLVEGSVPDVWKRLIDNSPEIDQLLPGFAALRDCFHGVGNHKEGDKSVLQHVALVTALGAGEVLRLREQDPSRAAVLLLALLLHDIRKPETRGEKAGGKVTFYGHAEAAAKEVPHYASLVGFDVEETQGLTYLIEHHMNAHTVLTWGPKKRIAIYESEWFELLAFLQGCDARGTWLDPEGRTTAPDLGEQLLADREQVRAEQKAAARSAKIKEWVTARLQALDVPASPLYGAITRAALTPGSLPDATDEEQVRAWVDSYPK